MRNYFYILLLSGFMLGCGNRSQLMFQFYETQWELCEKCPKIQVTIPKALNNTAEAFAFNAALDEEVTKLLPFNDPEKMQEISAIVTTTAAGNEAVAQEGEEEHLKWETKIKGEVIYENGSILTLMLSSYLYAGGTQGYGVTTYLNFDRKKGRKLESPELFENPEAFKKFAEDQFRRRENIPATATINATGFKFKGDTFHLPDNIGYTPNGLQLIYNPYEVAPYTRGPLVLTLPYKDVNPYLKQKVPLE